MNQFYLIIKNKKNEVVKTKKLSIKKECTPGSNNTLTHTHKTRIG